MAPTRRTFIASVALAGITGHVLGTRRLSATEALAHRRANGNSVLPDPTPADMLRALATAAMEAAKAAGVTYADFRINEQQTLYLGLASGQYVPSVSTNATCTYGIRVLVNGAWAFTHGCAPTTDAIATSVQNAVAQARSYATVVQRRSTILPAPVVTGEWASPVKIDPFTVSLEEQTNLLGALNRASSRVKYGGRIASTADWRRETRVFASTDGSLITQRLVRGAFEGEVTAQVGAAQLSLRLPELRAACGGYELLARPELQDRIKARTEDAVALATLPVQDIDVGRYDVVFDGTSMAGLAAATLGPALELDRALGYEAEASGTTYLAPPLEHLGGERFSSMLTVTSASEASDYNYVRWDDEGVACAPFTLIEKGVVRDYFTSRETASALQGWYTQHGNDVPPLRGCCTSDSPGRLPLIHASRVNVAPGGERLSLDDLVRNVQRGILIQDAGYVSADYQLTSGQVPFGIKLEVRNGKVIRRIRDAAIQFHTIPLWKSKLLALGDVSTVGTSGRFSSKGQPWDDARLYSAAPAGHFKDLDVIKTGSRLG